MKRRNRKPAVFHKQKGDWHDVGYTACGRVYRVGLEFKLESAYHWKHVNCLCCLKTRRVK